MSTDEMAVWVDALKHYTYFSNKEPLSMLPRTGVYCENIGVLNEVSMMIFLLEIFYDFKCHLLHRPAFRLNICFPQFGEELLDSNECTARNPSCTRV